MAEQRSQQPLFGENSTTIMTRGAAQLKERLTRASAPGESFDDQARTVQFLTPPARPGGDGGAPDDLEPPPLPGVSATQNRAIHLVPDPALDGASPSSSGSAPVVAPGVTLSAAVRNRRPPPGLQELRLDPAAGGVMKPAAERVQPKESPPTPKTSTQKKPEVRVEPDTERTPVDGTSHPTPKSPRGSSWLLIGLFALLGLGALGFAGYQTLRKERRPLQTALLGSGAATVPAQGVLKGVAVSKAADKQVASASSCARNSSQTISSLERDQLLLDIAIAFDKGRGVRAQELLRRYVQEACDNATLEALTILTRQQAASDKEASK